MPDSKTPTSSKALLDTLTDAASLPALVERLDPETLKHLVDDVGLEDSHALIEHANAGQIAHLLEESIWSGADPGHPERLSVAELLRWFDLWIDIGNNFIADKLFELGESFAALAFSKLVTVSEADISFRLVDEFTQVIGTYVVRTRFDDEWDSVQTALNALWEDYPDFLEAVFETLSFRHSILKMYGEDDAARVLDADASHAREQQREEKGFVTSAMAGVFLNSIAGGDLEEIAEESAYDLETGQYFVRRRSLKESREAGTSAAEKEELDSPPPGGMKPKEMEAELDALERELEQYELTRAGNVARLTGPDSHPVPDRMSIRQALTLLQDDPDALEARSNELSYLSNLLVEGAVLDGARLKEVDAANVVMATCNLGATYLLWVDMREEEDEPVAFVEMLRKEPGLVRLFRIGWNLLSRLPLQAAVRVSQTLSSQEAKDKLSVKPWVLSETDALLNQPDLKEVVRESKFEEAQETIKVLTIAFEPDVIPVLCLLMDGVPRFAKTLDGVVDTDKSRWGVADFDCRYVASMADLMIVDKFLKSLTEHIRI